MGREFAPLLRPPPLPLLAAGIELMILETSLALPAIANKQKSEGRYLTVLVSFDPQPSGRQHLRMFAASLIAPVATFEQAPEEGDVSGWLARTLNGRPLAAVCIVVSLPQYSLDTEQAVVAAMREMRDAHHDIDLVIAVAQNPADWAGCEGVNGFVMAREQRDAIALLMVGMVSSLTAPGFQCPIDANDLSQVMGTADTPSQFIEAMWFTQTNQLHFSSPEDLAVLGRAKAVAFMPAAILRFASLALLTRTIEGQLPASCSLVIVATYGLVNVVDASITPVSLLCR